MRMFRIGAQLVGGPARLRPGGDAESLVRTLVPDLEAQPVSRMIHPVAGTGDASRVYADRRLGRKWDIPPK